MIVYFKSVMMVLLVFSSFSMNEIPGAGKIDCKSCKLDDLKLFGKVQFVESFPDIKVQFVESFPDLKVKFVESFPDECGEWQVVNSFPDIKIQIVNSFPDLKIKAVENFPGCN